MAVLGFHHVGISTSDLDRSVAFYRTLFGFEIEFPSHPAWFRNAVRSKRYARRRRADSIPDANAVPTGFGALMMAHDWPDIANSLVECVEDEVLQLLMRAAPFDPGRV